MHTPRARQAILNEEIEKYVRKGYRVQSQTATTVQLIKPKSFSFFWAFVWFLLLGFGLVIYLLHYVAKKDEAVYIEIDEEGKVTVRG